MTNCGVFFGFQFEYLMWFLKCRIPAVTAIASEICSEYLIKDVSNNMLKQILFLMLPLVICKSNVPFCRRFVTGYEALYGIGDDSCEKAC